jgi:hypothetical protein
VRAFELAHAAHLFVHFEARQHHPASQARGPAFPSSRGLSLAAHAGLRGQFAFHGPYLLCQHSRNGAYTVRAKPSYIRS